MKIALWLILGLLLAILSGKYLFDGLIRKNVAWGILYMYYLPLCWLVPFAVWFYCFRGYF